MKHQSAFPQVNLQDSYGMLVPDRQEGMTLRDYFAAKTLQGLLSNRNAEAAIDEFAVKAYRMADAMLKAREQND
jgi:hypothetical protein